MLKKRLLSFKYAFKGIQTLASTQPNFQIHLGFTVLVITGGLIFNVSRIEWATLLLAIGLVLGAEGFNTAIEFLTDLVSPEYNELAGKVKDVAAGAVLLTAIAAACVGFIIFIPKILDIL